MNTVAGLTGIGLVTLVLFSTSVTVRVDTTELRHIEHRRRAAQAHAKEFGLDAKALEADPVYNRELFSRVGPREHLLQLKKRKENVAKGD